MEEIPQKKLFEMSYDFFKDAFLLTLSFTITSVVTGLTIEKAEYETTIAILTGVFLGMTVFFLVATVVLGWIVLKMEAEVREDDEISAQYIGKKLREIKPDN